MTPAVEQLVRETIELTGADTPQLLEGDAPVLSDEALAIASPDRTKPAGSDPADTGLASASSCALSSTRRSSRSVRHPPRRRAESM